MSDAEDRAEVCGVLQPLGLTTTAVPEDANTKRCDLRAHDDEGEHYLVEVKGFHDNADIGTALRQDAVHVGARPLVRSNAVEVGIEEAIKQIRATPMADGALWLVALINRTAYGADATRQQIHGTLYGIRPIVYVDSSDRNASRDCLYFSHSAFHRHPELDGAIVIDRSSVSLHLNDFGRRVDRVRKSVLGRAFAQRGALNDADILESHGGFFVADCGLDRKNEHAVLEYVKDKYCLECALVTNPTERSAMARVPRLRPKADSGRIE